MGHSWSPGQGGNSHWKVVWGCATLKTSLFRTHFCSEDGFFKQLPAPETPLPFLKKNLHFKTNFCQFWLNLWVPETQILAKFCCRDPSFKPGKKISSGDPIFENLAGTCLPKSPLGPLAMLFNLWTYIQCIVLVTSKH